MDKLKEYKHIIIIVLVILGVAFYYYELRPTQIRKECWARIEKIKNEKTTSNYFMSQEFLIKQGMQKEIDTFYSNCLKEKGLEK